FDGDRIAVRFQYESRDRDGRWWRSYGNELWEFDEHGLMRRREASINDVPIDEGERREPEPGRVGGDRGEQSTATVVARGEQGLAEPEAVVYRPDEGAGALLP